MISKKLGLGRQPKCGGCDKRLKKSEDAILKLDTAEGPIEMKLCNECAGLWNASAEILRNKKDAGSKSAKSVSD